MDTKFDMLELTKKYKSGTALEILQEAILSGELSGEITQNELAANLGVSRMPVREALIALEYQGLLERESNQHVRIAKLTEKNIFVIFQDFASIELDVLENLPREKFLDLSACDSQMKFHRLIRNYVREPFREKILEIMTEIYLRFVLDNAKNLERVNSAFENLLRSLRDMNLENLRENYRLYVEILASEFAFFRACIKESVSENETR